MPDDPRARLAELLDQRSAGALESVSDADVADLVKALETARETQREELQKAAENSLSFVPRLLRGAAKKLVFG